MWTWRRQAAETHPARPAKPIPNPSSSAQRRLFLLATGLITRGMKPEDAYRTALYYIEGPGRGRTWISALAEHDDRGRRPIDPEDRDAASRGEERPGVIRERSRGAQGTEPGGGESNEETSFRPV
jgi:hypothetical protein